MKIAWLHSHLLIPTGGTTFILEATRRIALRADVTLYCEQARDDIRQRFEDSGVRVRTIGTSTSTSAVYWLTLKRQLRRELDALRACVGDETAVISSMFPMNVLANGLTDRAIQYCYEPFAFFFSEAMVAGLPMAKRLFCRFLARRYGPLDIENTRRSPRIITLNPVTQKQMKIVYGVDSEISLAGVDTEFFQPTDDADLRATYASEKILMHSTDYSPVKASDLVIRALPEILRALPDARLLISNTLDDPRGRARLETLARQLGVAEKVTFLGCLDFDDMPKYYSLADVVVQPAYAAGAGTASMNLAVKEAMACGTAVIRADITDEDAQHAVSGMLVAPNDVPAIAAAAAKVLSDPDRAAKMGAAGRERIVELYNWDRVAGILYDNILQAFGRDG